MGEERHTCFHRDKSRSAVLAFASLVVNVVTTAGHTNSSDFKFRTREAFTWSPKCLVTLPGSLSVVVSMVSPLRTEFVSPEASPPMDPRPAAAGNRHLRLICLDG